MTTASTMRTTRVRSRSTGPDDDLDHASLLGRAQQGDPDALPELLHRFRPLVEGVARRQCRCAADIDDIVQEVSVALLLNVDRIHSPACLPGWVRRVTANAITQLGRRNRAVPVADTPEPRYPVDEGDLAVQRLARADACRSVRRALSRLRESDRRFVEMLVENERPDYARISARTNRPIGSIGPTRGRVFRRLQHDPDIKRLSVA